MSGIDARTGRPLGGFDHVLQSIEKILTTPVGSRVMRPWFGNPGLRLLGENMTEETILRWAAITWALIDLFEPRFKVVKFGVNDLQRLGIADMPMDGLYRPYAHLDFEQARAFVSYSNGSLQIRSGV